MGEIRLKVSTWVIQHCSFVPQEKGSEKRYVIALFSLTAFACTFPIPGVLDVALYALLLLLFIIIIIIIIVIIVIITVIIVIVIACIIIIIIIIIIVCYNSYYFMKYYYCPYLLVTTDNTIDAIADAAVSMSCSVVCRPHDRRSVPSAYLSIYVCMYV